MFHYIFILICIISLSAGNSPHFLFILCHLCGFLLFYYLWSLAHVWSLILRCINKITHLLSPVGRWSLAPPPSVPDVMDSQSKQEHRAWRTNPCDLRGVTQRWGEKKKSFFSSGHIFVTNVTPYRRSVSVEQKTISLNVSHSVLCRTQRSLSPTNQTAAETCHVMSLCCGQSLIHDEVKGRILRFREEFSVSTLPVLHTNNNKQTNKQSELTQAKQAEYKDQKIREITWKLSMKLKKIEKQNNWK